MFEEKVEYEPSAVSYSTSLAQLAVGEAGGNLLRIYSVQVSKAGCTVCLQGVLISFKISESTVLNYTIQWKWYHFTVNMLYRMEVWTWLRNYS